MARTDAENDGGHRRGHLSEEVSPGDPWGSSCFHCVTYQGDDHEKVIPSQGPGENAADIQPQRVEDPREHLRAYNVSGGLPPYFGERHGGVCNVTMKEIIMPSSAGRSLRSGSGPTSMVTLGGGGGMESLGTSIMTASNQRHRRRHSRGARDDEYVLLPGRMQAFAEWCPFARPLLRFPTAMNGMRPHDN